MTAVSTDLLGDEVEGDSEGAGGGVGFGVGLRWRRWAGESGSSVMTAMGGDGEVAGCDGGKHALMSVSEVRSTEVK